MKQVAALAGVGTKTVSRVINHEPNVAEATAKRVWDAVRALDYHVDLQAGSLRRADGRTRTLGLLVSSVDNPFAAAIHRTIEDTAIKHEVAVLASSADDDPEREEHAIRAFLRRRIDGLILTTAQRRSHGRYLSEQGIPLVYVDRESNDGGSDSVTSDNLAGARRATEHLIAHGHHRIALLTDRLEIQTARDRRQGFLDALGAAGIPVTESLVVSELHDADAAEHALGELLDLDEPPTAIFSAQNLITLGALHALRSRGLERTVALIGFDDLPLADLVDPGVSVISQNPQQIGQIAVERMFARLDGDDSAAQHIVVPTELIPRGSGEIRNAALSSLPAS